jgi:hypothetical protein
MTNANTADFNMDSLLDGTLDDLADVPGFGNPPAGAHKFSINWDTKPKDKAGYIVLKLTGIETIELTDASDTPMVAGTICTKQFNMQNEYGQSDFRKIMASLATHYGAGSNRELLEKSEGAECLIITKLKAGKKKEGSTEVPMFLDIVELSVI